MRDKLIDELLTFLFGYGIKDAEAKNSLYLILNSYEIGARETMPAVRNVDKNRMLMQKFIIAKTVKGCTEKTLKAYRYEIWKALENIGKPVDEVTPDDIRIYLAVRQKRDGISKSYADTELRYLRSFFGFLTDEGLISGSPVRRIEKIRADKKNRKAFNEMEIERLRDACRTKREKCVVEMLLSTGCRVSELVGMKLSDLSANRITIHGKGNKDRTVYLNAKAAVALENYINERHDENPYIFAGGYMKQKSGIKGNPCMWYTDPQQVTPDKHTDVGTVEAMIRKIGKNAGVKNAHPHRFRRTCATMALRHGMPLMTVSKMLGHENVSTTQIYLDLDEREVEQAHRRYVV